MKLNLVKGKTAYESADFQMGLHLLGMLTMESNYSNS